MFLTRITVNGIAIEKKHLYDAYRWKQELCNSIAPIEKADASGEKNWLCRFLVKESANEEVVYFQSQERPKLLPFGTWETKEIPNSFYKGGKYLFEVLANPTVKVVVLGEDGKRKKQGKREAAHPANYDSWLKRKLNEGGCEVEKLTVTPIGMQVCYRKGERIPAIAVQYKGILTVKNSLAFQKMAQTGIGHGRAFGFGLLLLKRV